MKQAKHGGEWVKGVFYKGGQFLPSNEPQRGKFNRPASKAPYARKIQVAPYTWEMEVEGKRSIYQMIAGTVAVVRNEKMSFVGNEKSLNYIGKTEAQVNELIEKYNQGQRWV